MSDAKQVADDVTPASILDAKGLSCPMPLLRTKKEMGKCNPNSSYKKPDDIHYG